MFFLESAGASSAGCRQPLRISQQPDL